MSLVDRLAAFFNPSKGEETTAEREYQLGIVVQYHGPYNNITQGPDKDMPALAQVAAIQRNYDKYPIGDDRRIRYGLVPVTDWYDKERGQLWLKAGDRAWTTITEKNELKLFEGPRPPDDGNSWTIWCPTFVPSSYLNPTKPT